MEGTIGTTFYYLCRNVWHQRKSTILLLCQCSLSIWIRFNKANCLGRIFMSCMWWKELQGGGQSVPKKIWKNIHVMRVVKRIAGQPVPGQMEIQLNWVEAEYTRKTHWDGGKRAIRKTNESFFVSSSAHNKSFFMRQLCKKISKIHIEWFIRWAKCMHRYLYNSPIYVSCWRTFQSSTKSLHRTLLCKM